ncbi:helix-hairpin-helix domain-containing protein [Alkalimarinus sediminis]|uniref:Helix-hairpin-helix domain-containing protein n=1 Tax=Alkalimarinus sediminis TaxID=1632866 RepID=A0A9E8HQ64_9ALTE|nr:helix-hairpin-helix domain-containing protein [Alkalimarinus sediminis]UZW73769.1 helix-hairpin-helix domain-containing protein [Alkalimarinus sediminis]
MAKASKKVKSKGDKVLKEINAKLKSTQKDLQKQVDELTSQVKTLSKDPGRPARKLIKKLEKGYHKKVAELQDEFDERMESVLKLQEKVIAQLPKELAEKLNLTDGKAAKPAKKAAKAPAAKAKKVSPAKPKATKPKAAKPKATRAPKAPTIGSINGIGPVVEKKLAEAGFTTLEDLANTPANKLEALKQFEKTRGFSTWKEKAQALLDSK